MARQSATARERGLDRALRCQGEALQRTGEPARASLAPRAENSGRWVRWCHHRADHGSSDQQKVTTLELLQETTAHTFIVALMVPYFGFDRPGGGSRGGE